MDHTGLTKSIADRYPELSPRLQLAARHVLDRPDDIALKSMRGIAADAGVHPTTMIRLARAFGYESYNDFRAPFQRRLRSHPGDYLGRARELQERGSQEALAIIDDVMAAAVSNTHQSFGANPADKLSGCAEVLMEADTIFVAGRRGCFPIAHYFHYIYSVFRSNSMLLDGGGGTFADRMRSFSKDDVLLAISFDPYSRNTVRAVEYARERGGRAVSLTDSLVSPLVADPDHTLIISNESPSFYQSVAPAMAIVEALVAIMVLKSGDAALSAISNTQRQLAHFDAYWNQP